MRFRLQMFFVVVAVVACNAGRSHEKALSEWKRNENIVEIAVNEGRSTEDEYLRSVIFFQNVTGIVIRGNAGTLGLLPNEYTVQDFRRVKQWCKANCRNLYWDEKSQSVRMAK